MVVSFPMPSCPLSSSLAEVLLVLGAACVTVGCVVLTEDDTTGLGGTTSGTGGSEVTPASDAGAGGNANGRTSGGVESAVVTPGHAGRGGTHVGGAPGNTGSPVAPGGGPGAGRELAAGTAGSVESPAAIAGAAGAGGMSSGGAAGNAGSPGGAVGAAGASAACGEAGAIPPELVGAWYGEDPDWYDERQCLIFCENGRFFGGDRPCTETDHPDFAQYLLYTVSGRTFCARSPEGVLFTGEYEIDADSGVFTIEIPEGEFVFALDQTADSPLCTSDDRIWAGW